MRLGKINLVIIGHKDHGKSTLVGRLLHDSKAVLAQKMREVEAEVKKTGDEGFRFAFLLDTLEEERKGALTIDIMHTPFKTKKNLYTIIDCPGHREFIKKMFTGASQADAAVLVVSAEEGIRDQTKQHAFLIRTLGIQQFIVALNKIDAVEYDETRFVEIRDQLVPILKSLEYENSPIVPVSALTGENVFQKQKRMQWYKGLSLVETLDAVVKPSAPPVDKPLRGCVQDIYEINGERIIICKILTGILTEGKIIRFDPLGEKGRVRKIQVFGKGIDRAGPGDSVGLSVDGIRGVERGEVISYPRRRASVVESFVAEIILLSDITMEKGDVLAIRCGTAEKKCEVRRILEKIDAINLTVDAKFPDSLKGGDVGKLLLSPIEQMSIERFSEFPELGRFVVEGKKGTVAAGIVLEIQPIDKN